MEKQTKPKSKITDTLNVLLVCTSQCNLNCKYCYCNDEQTSAMNPGVFQHIFKSIDEYFRQDMEFHFIFHGGEPLLLGEGFFRDTFEFLEKQQRAYHTSIQTNLTLINEEFLTLFKDNNCTIGTSLDGSQEMHDANRIYKDGRGSYRDTQGAISLLKEKEAPFGGLIVTLNSRNALDPPALYSSLKTFGDVPIGFSIVFTQSDVPGISVESGQLGKALIELFDLWVNDDSPVQLTYFENIVRNFLDINLSPECTFSKACADHFIAIDPQGAVYPCCDFVGINKYSYGNIFDSAFSEIWNSPLRGALASRCATGNIPIGCAECKHLKVCNSGCMAKTRQDFMEKDSYCVAYKMLFDYIGNSLPILGI